MVVGGEGGKEGSRGLVGPDKDWMDQYRGFLFWKGPRGHPCPSSHGLRPGAFPSLGLPRLCLAKLVWKVLFLTEQHPQIQAWFLLGVLTGATAPLCKSKYLSRVKKWRVREDMHASWSWKEP